MKTLPSQARLKELFDYDPETGEMRWKPGIPRWGGQIAGSLHKVHKRCVISIGKQRFYAARLIWKWMTGDDPPAEIDHWDADGTNDRWENLRPATRGQNLANTGPRKRNKSGLKGASFHPASGLWRSRLYHNGQHHFLGYFKTAEEAHEAYCKAVREMHGAFSRY
jgi:HNH endonuclease